MHTRRLRLFIAVDSQALAQISSTLETYCCCCVVTNMAAVRKSRTRADFSITSADLQDEMHEFMSLHPDKNLPEVLAPMASVHRDRTNRQGLNKLHMKCTGELILACMSAFDGNKFNLYIIVYIEHT